MDALEEADPEDVANLPSQAIGVLEQLGGSAPHDDGQDDSDNELEAKSDRAAAAARSLSLAIRPRSMRPASSRSRIHVAFGSVLERPM